MLILRGHHLLCIRAFQGKGYDDDFVENMTKIVREFKGKDLELKVKTVAATDGICEKCPYRNNVKCRSDFDDSKVIEMDRRVLAHLSLAEGKVYKKSLLLNKVTTKVTPTDLEYLCHNCSWLKYGICKEAFI